MRRPVLALASVALALVTTASSGAANDPAEPTPTAGWTAEVGPSASLDGWSARYVGTTVEVYDVEGVLRAVTLAGDASAPAPPVVTVYDTAGDVRGVTEVVPDPPETTTTTAPCEWVVISGDYEYVEGEGPKRWETAVCR